MMLRIAQHLQLLLLNRECERIIKKTGFLTVEDLFQIRIKQHDIVDYLVLCRVIFQASPTLQ